MAGREGLEQLKDRDGKGNMEREHMEQMGGTKGGEVIGRRRGERMEGEGLVGEGMGTKRMGEDMGGEWDCSQFSPRRATFSHLQLKFAFLLHFRSSCNTVSFQQQRWN